MTQTDNVNISVTKGQLLRDKDRQCHTSGQLLCDNDNDIYDRVRQKLPNNRIKTLMTKTNSSICHTLVT